MKIAVIPARGGSKRIPRKNVRQFCGKPLLAYPIDICLQSGLFKHVIVSTDSEEIAEVARACGAEVPFMRPPELAGDFVATAPVVKHTVAWVDEHWGSVAYCCQLYANPFITLSHLQQGFELLRERGVHETLVIVEFPYPILRAFQLSDAGTVDYAFPQYRSARSQDLPVFYHDAAQFYWHDCAKMHEDGEHKSLPVIIPRHRAVDIDTEEDWRVAERLYMALSLRDRSM